MPIYTCQKCGKVFDHKSHWIAHTTKRKSACDNQIDGKIIMAIQSDAVDELAPLAECSVPAMAKGVNTKIDKTQCRYCPKRFTTETSKYRHERKYCENKKKKVENETNANKDNQELRKEIDELKEIVKSLQEQIKITDSTIYNNSHNINNTINNNNKIINNNSKTINNNIDIKILQFGKEDTSYITTRDYKQLLNKGFQSVQELVKKIHFDKDHPQNHNIYISNLRTNDILIFNGTDWEVGDCKETIEDLYKTKKEILDEKYEELKEQLSDQMKNKFERFRNYIEDDKIRKDECKETKRLVYNNRKIVLKKTQNNLLQ